MKIKMISIVFIGLVTVSNAFGEDTLTKEKTIENLLGGVVDVFTIGGEKYQIQIHQPFPEEFPDIISAKIIHFYRQWREDRHRFYTLYDGLSVSVKEVPGRERDEDPMVMELNCFKRTPDNSYINVLLSKEFFEENEKVRTEGTILEEKAFFKYRSINHR